MKKFLSILLAFTMIFSLKFMSPALAKDNSKSILDTNKKSEMNLIIDYKKSGSSNKNSTISLDSFSFPNSLTVIGKFTGTNTFTITAKNFGIDAIDSVKYKITVYDYSGNIVGGQSTNVGAIGAMGEVPERYYFRNGYKVVVVVTTIESGTTTVTEGYFTKDE